MDSGFAAPPEIHMHMPVPAGCGNGNVHDLYFAPFKAAPGPSQQMQVANPGPAYTFTHQEPGGKIPLTAALQNYWVTLLKYGADV